MVHNWWKEISCVVGANGGVCWFGFGSRPHPNARGHKPCPHLRVAIGPVDSRLPGRKRCHCACVYVVGAPCVCGARMDQVAGHVGSHGSGAPGPVLAGGAAVARSAPLGGWGGGLRGGGGGVTCHLSLPGLLGLSVGGGGGGFRLGLPQPLCS